MNALTTATTAVSRLIGLMQQLPNSAIALLARFSIAAVFWKSGQTKIEGLAIDIVEGSFQLGWPSISDSTFFLFTEEYRLPLIPPVLGAYAATFAEHLFPLLLLIGLATRFSALALLGMTLVIQLFVYPSAYGVHGLWASVLLYLMAQGPGKLSLDHLLGRRYKHCPLPTPLAAGPKA